MRPTGTCRQAGVHVAAGKMSERKKKGSKKKGQPGGADAAAEDFELDAAMAAYNEEPSLARNDSAFFKSAEEQLLQSGLPHAQVNEMI